MSYHIFFKKEITEISSAKLSDMLGMEVDFDSYDFIDENTLVIKGLSIKTPYPRSRYEQENEYQTDWIIARISHVSLGKFNYKELIQNNRFYASHIEIDTAEVEVYRDKTLPEPPFKKKPLLSTIFSDIKADIKVDTVLLRQINITYLEKTKFSEDPGKITFENLYATGYHLTNDTVRLRENPYFTIDAQTDVMGQAKITSNVVFNLLDDHDSFTFNAEVSAFPATMLNPAITGVLPGKITEGSVESIEVQFEGNDDNSTGKVNFQYKDIQFKLFDDEEESEIKSFAATQLGRAAVRKTNMKDDNNYRQGDIYFERKKDRFIFNYWWNSLKSGLTDVMLTDAAKLFINNDKKKE